MAALGINVTTAEPMTWHSQRPTHNRQPLEIIRLRKAKDEAWETHNHLCDICDPYSEQGAAKLEEALDTALAADKAYSAAYENYWAHPDEWWQAEDAADDAQMYSELRRGG